jgi:predicted DNA-binding transcriptional regulator YafY
MVQKTSSVHDDSLRISGVRAGRLYKLLKQLSSGPAQRSTMLKRLRVGMRTFYRDIDLLRECGVEIETRAEGYSLTESLEDALDRLPFPDPELTFGDVLVLMKGRSSSHQKLRKLLEQLTK